MDEKISEEITPKISRSRARHLRRKRLLIARKTGSEISDSNFNNTSPNISIINIKNTDINVDTTKISDKNKINLVAKKTTSQEINSHAVEITQNKILTKSKARRLRKRKNKKNLVCQNQSDNEEILEKKIQEIEKTLEGINDQITTTNTTTQLSIGHCYFHDNEVGLKINLDLSNKSLLNNKNNGNINSKNSENSDKNIKNNKNNKTEKDSENKNSISDDTNLVNNSSDILSNSSSKGIEIASIRIPNYNKNNKSKNKNTSEDEKTLIDDKNFTGSTANVDNKNGVKKVPSLNRGELEIDENASLCDKNNDDHVDEINNKILYKESKAKINNNKSAENIVKNSTTDITNLTTGASISSSLIDNSNLDSFKNSGANNSNMNAEQKSREQIKVEREAKKAAKLAAKNKSKNKNDDKTSDYKNDKKQEKEDEKSCARLSVTKTPQDKKTTQKSAENTATSGDDSPEMQSLTKEISNLSLENQQKIIKNLSMESQIGGKIEGKSKSALRAERRARQEAQRAAKEAAIKTENIKKDVASSKSAVKSSTIGSKTSEKDNKIDDEMKKLSKKSATSILQSINHEINLFKHLYHERQQATINLPAVNSSIHPAVVRLGVQYANKIIVGSNARCIALLAALKQLIKDYETPSQADFSRGLETSFQESMAYLHHCRPIAVSMLNALRNLKWRISQLPASISDEEAKSKLENAIDTYIKEQILLADEAISQKIRTKIYKNDVILTYGYSSLIQKVLCDAYDAGREFHVIVVDGRPWLEGRELLRRLAKHGVSCSYVLINALSFMMPEVSKVFLGAHAILANGAVMSRAGTAQVALMAKTFNVPVLVACETHKSCERVQTDSIVYNEIGNADELTFGTLERNKKTILANWRAKKSLNLLNIIYDVTPADLVTAVVTELAILPCTSVPVILRIKPSEI